jgi:hypothetical protein
MVSKSSRTRKSRENPTSGSSSSHRDSIREPKPKPLSHPHYLVVDSTLPSHVFTDRSLFTTYVPSRKHHRTVYGTDIIIEGTGDVHVRVIVSGKSILFRFRDSWHVPSSPQHFLSCSTVISLGHQVMLAGRSPRMIFSHKRRLIVPELPKYIPFTRVDGLIALSFDIPAQGSFSPEPEPTLTTTRSPAAQTVLSLSASSYPPFAALAFHQSPLPNPQQDSFSGPPTHSSANEVVTAAGVHGHVAVVSDSSAGVVLHGGAQALVDMKKVTFPGSCPSQAASAYKHADIIMSDTNAAAVVLHGGAHADVVNVAASDATSGECAGFVSNTSATVESVHGDADAQVTLDVKDVVFDLSHGGADAQSELEANTAAMTLTASLLDFSNLELEDGHGTFTLRSSESACYTHHYFPRVLSRSLPSFLNVDATCFPYSPLSSCDNSPFLLSTPPFYTLSVSESSFLTSVRNHFSLRPHNSTFNSSHHVSSHRLFSGFSVPIWLHSSFSQSPLSNLHFCNFIFFSSRFSEVFCFRTTNSPNFPVSSISPLTFSSRSTLTPGAKFLPCISYYNGDDYDDRSLNHNLCTCCPTTISIDTSKDLPTPLCHFTQISSESSYISRCVSE